MLLIYSQDAPERWAALTEPEQRAIMAEYQAVSDHPSTLAGAQLQPGGTATTVRVDNGTALTTDGPYAETKEVRGGYSLIEGDDLDGPLEVASRTPAARRGGGVEVRPVV